MNAGGARNRNGTWTHEFFCHENIYPWCSTLLISCGIFSPKNSERMPHSSPVRAMYVWGVFCEFTVSTECNLSSPCIVINIVLYSTAIYRESRVSTRSESSFSLPAYFCMKDGNSSAELEWKTSSDRTTSNTLKRNSRQNNISVPLLTQKCQHFDDIFFTSCIENIWQLSVQPVIELHKKDNLSVLCNPLVNSNAELDYLNALTL